VNVSASVLEAIQREVARPCEDAVSLVEFSDDASDRFHEELAELPVFPSWAEGIDVGLSPDPTALVGGFRVCRVRASGAEYWAETVRPEPMGVLQ
jgi:hypothetical protein